MSAAPSALPPLFTYPLDPLNEREIKRATDILMAEKGLPATTRFADFRLDEPAKADVLAWTPGAKVARRAFIITVDTRSGDIHEAVVDITAKRVVSFAKREARSAPYGQPPIIIEEFFKTGAIVKADPGWRHAMTRRGLTDDEIELVQIDPFSAGYFAREVETGRRLVSAVSYYRADIKDNGYASPIEGVVALVDLIEERVVQLVDDEEIIPIPKKKRNYNRESLGTPRQDVRPLDIVQKEGPSFSVDGWKVDWQNWSFRLGFTPREGLVLHQLSYRDGGRDRPIIYRASVTEMVVPYADPTTNHFWKSAFDAGEYGLGKLANALELGCDCLGLIRYFDIPAADDLGQPMVMKNAICMHEEDYGILWKHYEFRNDTYEVRRSRRLVISFFATVGNYDYGFYWYLYQDGTIQLEAKLTGIIQTAAVAPGKSYPWGGMVDEGLGGPTHQHFFNVRMHMMVDGEKNTVTEHEFHPRPWGTDNPHGNVFDTTSRVLARERDAAREADGRTGRYWKISNPNARNSVGNPPGYKLIVQPSPLMLAQEGSYVRQRGGFATKHVWVTHYDPAERYASGDYPNQHAGGDGLPRYVAQNRPIENEDIVVWHSFGHTHVCKPEDFPIMPVEYAGFMLKPNGFFAGNPAMDLPPDRNGASIDGRDGSCCA
ncbi:primary-amine oxidase [Phreatobacter aquaticus]|uniref:Amine oxidase n=1 Tax=Phreatobacter aquaticus TaxID=2570229 RepID=A0A4D7QBP8_9HYPH|nr:primary-amine oxidase [Phreatobacter aquaticus]QCK84568.1 primary-amine oxidase [Phreatobacter aquaticus]